MKLSKEDLDDIYDQTSGKCHICHVRVARRSYAKTWEIDHSNPRANGGTDRKNNLKVACVSCNRSKGARLSSKQARANFGKSREPLSSSARRETMAVRAGLTGLGTLVATRALGLLGPVGMFVSVGAMLLSLAVDPDD